MSTFTKALVAVVLVFYGLALSHCRIELLPGFQFLSCCEHEDTAPHQDSDCQQDACSVVESGFYKTTDHDEAAPAPLLVVGYESPTDSGRISSDDAQVELCSSPPLELPRIWQFCFRAALPPRAPSCLS